MLARGSFWDRRAARDARLQCLSATGESACKRPKAFQAKAKAVCVCQVPTNLVLDPAFAAAPEEAFVEALLATNDQLHHSAVDDAMSGTTAVSALVRGRTLYVANVGDSRAVLAERAPGGRLTAVPLSYDHTPFRHALLLAHTRELRCLQRLVGHPSAVRTQLPARDFDRVWVKIGLVNGRPSALRLQPWSCKGQVR